MAEAMLLETIRKRRAAVQAEIEALTEKLRALDAAAYALGDDVPRRRQKRHPVTDARLDEVANIYLSAEDYPTRAVRDALGGSYSRAAHLVVEARKAGKIPPA